ncbi:UDP-4-amino-4,6-dideoxy-N-acetyl-beta-L-altrosamine transaminase [Asticcacaulis sp. EMRT-3]|uniref:UDP-4-amino-4, 6-dideoxy-N-acetyl-beta-L-altrosamine transaminase n=1 Tax=Asticcacaulis sp. EMRT-3 TaxID=3040349 RepID=UPI0024AF87AB|nr:UDP-4-amino-4,6-dideoxy-N-acetyl-beta-L-altrosamine transaminase [Asticcacaulis sp. EMRT-3]MDI7776123.1 UDP-4-amino-4,6-dideoxy-N-acetyl-beta-L-altrosamine transaminase [Asticcacaulis sp. EMRT-3]
MSFLPYGRQSIDDTDIAAVVAALQSDFLTTGPLVDQFEQALAQTVGAQEAVVVSNGTAALHLAVMSENLSPKDVVIVPAITFAATANAVAYCGAQVVFGDVDPLTGLMSDEGFDAALELIARDYADHRFAGVIPVHYAGRTVDLTHIAEVAGMHGAFVIEDACHALGSVGPQGRVGSCAASDMACFSFHPVKTLTTGEGGAITLNDPVRARRLRALRSHGIERDPAHFVAEERGPWVYEMQALGYNYRLPDLNCALGLSQLQRLAHFAERRAKLVGQYQKALGASNLPVRWAAPLPGETPVFHLFAVSIDFAGLGMTREAVMEALRARGIGTQVHYIPVPDMPYWQHNALGKRDLPGTEQFYTTTLSLPLFADMSDDDPARVVAALSEVLHGS